MKNIHIEYKKISELKPYRNNPRKNNKAVDAVAKSIEEFGFKNPIIIDGTGEIIAGHTRLKAAEKLGFEEVPTVEVADLTDEQVKAFRIADNRTAELSSWDFELLESELSEIKEVDFDTMGFAGLEPDFENLEEMTADDDDDEYLEFTEKFKPKKTTDDCFTPPLVYEAVKDWAIKEYGIPDDAEIIRPFYPGGDYEKHEYPEGCVVIDNPPFSILAEIKRFYHEKNIKYFLFAPHLTMFSAKGEGERYIITDSDVIYENGAKVTTSFVTNMDRYKIRTASELAEAIDRAVEEGRERAPEMPAYDYPLEVVTAARLARIARVDFKVLPEHCHFTRQLDSQKETGAALYGAGYLIAEKAAAEKAAAREVQVWELSEREKEIIKKLGEADAGEDV